MRQGKDQAKTKLGKSARRVTRSRVLRSARFPLLLYTDAEGHAFWGYGLEDVSPPHETLIAAD